MKVEAAVLYEHNKPLRLETLELAEPKSGEFLIRMGAVGDHVVLSWIPYCGTCFYCTSDRTHLCETYKSPLWDGTMMDGTCRLSGDAGPVRHLSMLACWADHAVVPQESCVEIPKDVPFEVAALLGCAVTTGVGAALNRARVAPGSSVVVVGAGGVGLSIIMGTRLAGADQIIAGDADADIELAARGIVAGIFPPAGQSCIAGSRVLVHHSLHDALLDRIVALTKPARIGDQANPDTHITPMANQQQFDRVLHAIDQAKSEGAICVLGGEAVHPAGCDGWFIEPTIFKDVTHQMALAREEIFGPVLAVISVRDDARAIQLADDSDFGLAAGIWTSNSAYAMGLAEQVAAGTVYINTYFGSVPQSPDGGFKQSGYGRENGIEGLLAFTQTKSVWLAINPEQPEPFA